MDSKNGCKEQIVKIVIFSDRIQKIIKHKNSGDMKNQVQQMVKKVVTPKKVGCKNKVKGVQWSVIVLVNDLWR